MSGVTAIDQVLADLEHSRDEIEAMSAELCGAEVRLSTAQTYDMTQAKDDYELVVAMATMEAYASDAVNGKNQKQRDTQLVVWLGQHKEVKAAKHALRKAEFKVLLAEGDIDVTRRNYTIATNRLWALRAMAELHAARLNAMAGVECQSQRGERVR